MNDQNRRDARLNQLLSRRTFFAALGLGFSVPMASKMARLAVAQESARPTRLFLYYLPHGMPIEHWLVDESMNLAASGAGILSPLESVKEYVTVLRGVGINTSTNHAAIRSTFTGAESSNSIDYEVAIALGSTAHVLGAHANPQGAGADGQLIKHGGWVDPIANPADALSDLFSGLAPGTAPPPESSQDLAFEFRREGLVLTEGELEAMQVKLKGLTGEENKLSIHLESLRAYRSAAESGGGLGTVSCESRPLLSSAEGMSGKDPYDVSNLGEVIDGHLEASAQAMLCGTARIITLQNLHANGQVMMNFPGGPGFAANHHDPLSHSGKDATQGRLDFAEVQKWYMRKLTEKFLNVLKAEDPADPGRTVLDNTTVLVLSEVVDGANHTSGYTKETWDVPGGPRETFLPAILIGKGGGAFKGGQSVYVPGADHRDLLATVAHGMGVSLTSFAGKSVSPLSEVLA